MEVRAEECESGPHLRLMVRDLIFEPRISGKFSRTECLFYDEVEFRLPKEVLTNFDGLKMNSLSLDLSSLLLALEGECLLDKQERAYIY